MKSAIKILSLLFITVFTLSSCSKDDDPADNDLFIGKYSGSVSYSADGKTTNNNNGSVTVAKVGENYTFNFSDAIPTLSGIKMAKGDNNTVVFNDGALGSISISASKLTILYAKDGKSWGANCNR